MPSLPAHAEAHGLSWSCYTGRSGYPVEFYRELAGSQNIKRSGEFVTEAAAGRLPALSFLWHDSPLDEHPVADVRLGMNAIWQAVDAVVRAGQWTDTVFLLTWDDWGGWDDHVATPTVEYTPDNVQLAYGPRVPLLMFGGHVRSGIDSRWCSHVSIGKTALELLGLPGLGVTRLDQDPGLADLVDPTVENPAPPPFGGAIKPPTPPVPPLKPRPTPAFPQAPEPVAPIVLNGGKQLPPPNDVPLTRRPKPPVKSRARKRS